MKPRWIWKTGWASTPWWWFIVVLQAVFPFYYAILTSLEDGQALFEVNYLPAGAEFFANYQAMLSEGVFGKQILNSVFVATVVVDPVAVPCGDRRLRPVAHPLSGAGPVAADGAVGVHVPADRGAVRLFEVIRLFRTCSTRCGAWSFPT